MRNKHCVVIILEIHPLYFPNSNLLDLNNSFVSKILGSLGSQTEIPALSDHPPQAKSKGLLHGVYRFFHMEATFLPNPQPPHHRLPLHSCHPELPRVHRPVSLHSFPEDWNLPTSLPGHLQVPMPGRQAAPQH